MPDQPCEYCDSYSTCLETYSTLRIFSDDLTPDEITRILEIEPTKTFRKGEAYSGGRGHRKTNGWFFKTRKLHTSRDNRRHIDLILTTLAGKEIQIKILHDKKCQIDITSYYASIGQGGPWLMPQQMIKLGNLGIEISWDIYFREEEPPKS